MATEGWLIYINATLVEVVCEPTNKNISAHVKVLQVQAVNVTPVWFTVKGEVYILCVGRVSLWKQPSFFSPSLSGIL